MQYCKFCRTALRVRSARWLTITVTSVVIVTGVFSALAFFLLPSISLRSPNVVSPGGTLSSHGTGFFSGSRVTLTLDDRVPLAVTLEMAALPPPAPSPPPQCPEGSVGAPPNCHCPPGMVGKPPNCSVVCPPGYRLLGGVCVPEASPEGSPPPLPPFRPLGRLPPCSSLFDPQCQPPQ